MKKNRKIYKRLLILAIAIYIIFILINQQKTLNQYSQETANLNAQIKEQQEYKEQLAKQKDDVSSLDYIEKTAREMLDIYYPNERVYIDGGM